jgi:hypothetical protein
MCDILVHQNACFNSISSGSNLIKDDVEFDINDYLTIDS